MTPRVKYWIFLWGIALAVFGIILGSFFASWYHLSGEEQAYVWALAEKLLPFPIIGAFYLVLIIGSMVSLLFRYYVIPILKLSEETRLISLVNAGHRIEPRGAKEVVQLTEVINNSAAAYQALQCDVVQQIGTAKQQLKDERNRLAALMSELPSGVLVCNSAGQILLYNPQAQKMLQQPGRLIGLGRSLFNLLDREPVIHALNILDRAVRQGQAAPNTSFIVAVHGDRCLRVTMTPLFEAPDDTPVISGFILAIEDMTREIDAELQGDSLLQTLTEAMQFSIGEIRAAISAILADPELPPAELDRHRQDIDRASQAIEDQLQHARSEHARHRYAKAKAENILGSDLLELLAKHIGERLGVPVRASAAPELWLRLDSFALTQGLARLGDILKQAGIRELALQLEPHTDRRVRLRIRWPDVCLDNASLREWQRRPLMQDAKNQPVSFLDLVGEYGGTVDIDTTQTSQCDGFTLTLPLIEPEPGRQEPAGPEHRPINYEFDLFRQTGGEDLGRVPLSRLTFVVFDTETTGLNPSEGDEIIQIGAIRIVNGRILREETLDQLVDPRRPVPAESVAIHGIDPALLVGQPTIVQVLPTFHHFAEGSVLVAHNAAFDMRFLQLRQEAAGVCFDHPVLDTLLLSSVVHPHQSQHSLEGIARLFDIPIVGRHTALGDAIVTAEVLVRLIPLLEAKGIHTLEDAVRASAASPFARLKF